MASKLKEIEEKALQLSPHDRAQLAKYLIKSLDEADDAEAERLWIEEAERRYREYKKGKVKGIAAQVVFKKVRSKLR